VHTFTVRDNRYGAIIEGLPATEAYAWARYFNSKPAYKMAAPFTVSFHAKLPEAEVIPFPKRR
jgi:hypothetical protein